MGRKPRRLATPDKDFNPGQARWCDEHNRLECTKHKVRGGGICHQAATRGTDACKNHAGVSREIAEAQGEARITAWSAMGKAIDLDPGMAVLGVLQMSWLRLQAYSQLLRQQVATDGQVADDPGEKDQPSASGLIGYKYGAAGKEGTVYVQGEEARALVVLEAAERDRVVRFAKVAHDMGISERLTNLAERWGDIVATRVTIILDGLDLTPEQSARVPMLVQAHLGAIDTEELTSG